MDQTGDSKNNVHPIPSLITEMQWYAELAAMTDEQLANKLNFGTTMTESFRAYIIRIEAQLDVWLSIRGSVNSYIIHVIMKIFEDVVCNPQGVKFPQMIEYLKDKLKREPTIDDMNQLVKDTRRRLELKGQNYDRERKEGILPE